MSGKKEFLLAEALLRRKELNDKVAQLLPLKKSNILETVVQRVKVMDGVDEVTAVVPRTTMADLTREFDSYATKLRKVDASIQRANWETQVSIDADVFDNFEPEEVVVAKRARGAGKKTLSRLAKGK